MEGYLEHKGGEGCRVVADDQLLPVFALQTGVFTLHTGVYGAYGSPRLFTVSRYFPHPKIYCLHNTNAFS